MVEQSRFQCPCCQFWTYNEAPGATYDICPVCYWEDDRIQFNDPDYEGGANVVSLNQARANFKAFGASEKQFQSSVRKPLGDELGPE